MLKVAIVGCGKIADAHVSQILRVGGAEIVGVCDREPLMAQQLRERFPIKRCFRDVRDLLRDARPEVVHITTPADSHFEIATLCLEHGCNVYVEKPFTLYAHEAQKLIELANHKRLKLTVGHSDQFSPVARRMRALVKAGYVGTPVHLESYYGYDLGDQNYAHALLGDKCHWVRRLPGKLLQNIISHGIARIAEFWSDDSPHVIAYGFISPFLQQIGESDIVDELRVIISGRGGLTAYFTFSSQMRPSIHEFRIYGSNNGLVLDHDHETLIRLRGIKFKSYADKFIPPVLAAKQYLGNCLESARLFLARDFHVDGGIKYLIESFYHSIQENTAPPITYREILLTARMMDTIFEQLTAVTTLQGHSQSPMSSIEQRNDISLAALR